MQPAEAEAELTAPLEEPVPVIEWWDARICAEGGTYDAMAAAGSEAPFLLREKISNLVQHPVLLEPPAEAPEPAPRPLMLTKKVRTVFLNCLLVCAISRVLIALDPSSAVVLEKKCCAGSQTVLQPRVSRPLCAGTTCCGCSIGC